MGPGRSALLLLCDGYVNPFGYSRREMDTFEEISTASRDCAKASMALDRKDCVEMLEGRSRVLSLNMDAVVGATRQRCLQSWLLHQGQWTQPVPARFLVGSSVIAGDICSVGASGSWTGVSSD